MDDTKQKGYIPSTSVMLTLPYHKVISSKSTSLIKLLHVIRGGKTVCLLLALLSGDEKVICRWCTFLHVEFFRNPEPVLILTAA